MKTFRFTVTLVLCLLLILTNMFVFEMCCQHNLAVDKTSRQGSMNED